MAVAVPAGTGQGDARGALVIDVAAWRRVYETMATAIEALGTVLDSHAETKLISTAPVDELSKCNLLPPEPVNGLCKENLPLATPLEVSDAGTPVAQIVRTVHSTSVPAFDLVPPVLPVRGVHVNVGKSDTAEAEKLFSDFWDAYPRRTGRKDALRAFLKLKPTAALVAQLLAAIKVQRESKHWRDGFIPHASTWLNGERWTDDLDTVPKAITGPMTRGERITARNRQTLAILLEDARHALGGRPDDRGDAGAVDPDDPHARRDVRRGSEP